MSIFSLETIGFWSLGLESQTKYGNGTENCPQFRLGNGIWATFTFVLRTHSLVSTVSVVNFFLFEQRACDENVSTFHFLRRIEIKIRIDPL